ncbi:hypothetical protein [Streptomyces sp. YGL11-2]
MRKRLPSMATRPGTSMLLAYSTIVTVALPSTADNLNAGMT